jgi:hypothetical protein
MTTERLAWAETPDAAALQALPGSEPAVSAKRARRRRVFHRSARIITRTTDALTTSLAMIGLCIAAGIDIWTVPLAAAMPYVLLPIAGVAGVWLAGGYRFRYAESIVGHLLRVVLGASVAMGSVFLIVLLAGSANTALFARLTAAEALVLFALHANYIRAVRSVSRLLGAWPRGR